MNETIVLHVSPTIADEISRDLKGCEGVTPFSALKSSIDGNIPAVIITVFAVKEAIRLVRDIILRYIDHQQIDTIRMGGFEAKGASPEAIEHLFKIYMQSQEGAAPGLSGSSKSQASDDKGLYPEPLTENMPRNTTK